MNSHRLVLFCLLAFLTQISACAHLEKHTLTGTDICITSDWPQDSSDLQPDPAITFGRLDNGLRFLVLENREPANRVGLYLNVQAGSIQETEEQRGLAHYLEHMLFNGTTHYPPGTLVEYFQSIGMGFGADTNAHTGFDETVYKLLLPSGREDMLDEGFVVLADYARGALLLEDEVDRERGIILAEKRARDSVGSRVWKKQLKYSFNGTMVAKRDPIGTEKTLDSANSELLRAYYDSWYRPENLMVVVVGDMDRDGAVALIKKHFSPLTAGIGQPECFDFGQVEEGGTDILYLDEPELGHASVSIGTVQNRVPHADTLAWEEQQFKAYIAVSMMANRLETLTRKTGSPLTRARANSGIFLQRIGYAGLSAETEGGNWQESLSLLQYSLRQALADGFTENELTRAKKQFIAYLEKQVQTAGSKDSRELADSLIRKINNNEVTLSPQQEMQLYSPMLEQLTLNQVNAAFNKVWEPKRRLIEVVGTADLKSETSSPEELISAAYTAGTEKPTSPWVGENQRDFPYLEMPKNPAEIAEQEVHRAIGVYSYRLANGTRVNIKKTSFKQNEINLSFHFGQGTVGEPKPGLGILAKSVVQESGFLQMEREQIERVLAGTNVELAFNVGKESFSLDGKGLNSELELLLQLFYSQLFDPAFRKSAFNRSKEQFNQMYDQMEQSVDGIQQLKGENFLAKGNKLYGVVARDTFTKLQLEDVQKWLGPVFAGASLEINVVGDLDVEESLELIRRYFGTEKRESLPQLQVQESHFPTHQALNLSAPTSIDKSLLTVAWKTDDFWDIQRTRRLNVLASVFDDRLRKKIREELGATYSPVVYNLSSRVYKGFGVMRCRLTIDPRQAEMLTGVIKTVAGEMVKGGIGEGELTRALEPTLTSIRDYKRSNKYWLQSVLSLSSRYPQQLEWPKSFVEDFASITASELTALARMYLQPDAAAVVIVGPKLEH